MTGVPVGLFAGSRLGADESFEDGEAIETNDIRLEVIHTSGHSSDHLCFYFPEEKGLFTGDLILGQGTTVIAYPDGNLSDYLESLKKLQKLNLKKIFPGHGPVIEHPQEKIREYIDHRMMRERQILASLSYGAKSAREIVKEIYADVDPRLHSFAELSVRAHLAKLED
jgi:glyoxylase-like metal-dependent hydrolase (beta-lactamase superfamily II)